MIQRSENDTLMAVTRAQAPLAIIWVIGVTAISLVFGVQTMNGRFGDEVSATAAWEWLARWLTPGVSVVLGGLVAGATGLIDTAYRSGVRPLLFWIAIWFSTVYLIALLSIVIGVSFLDGGPFAAFRVADVPLSFAQSITLFTLTLFFARRERAERSPTFADTVAAE